MTMISRWAASHVGTVAAWVGMAATLLVSLGSHWAMYEDHRETSEARLNALDIQVDGHEEALGMIRSDVRSLAESQQRAIDVIERTDEGLRALEQVTAQLKALVASKTGAK